MKFITFSTVSKKTLSKYTCAFILRWGIQPLVNDVFMRLILLNNFSNSLSYANFCTSLNIYILTNATSATNRDIRTVEN